MNFASTTDIAFFSPLNPYVEAVLNFVMPFIVLYAGAGMMLIFVVIPTMILIHLGREIYKNI